MAASPPVSVLLLGSGWTSRFVLPLLKRKGISHACTKRAPSDSDGSHVFPLQVNAALEQSATGFQALPQADIVVFVFPLTSSEMIDGIIGAYEKAKQCQPAWLALGSTGGWSKGVSTSSTPPMATNARTQAESHLLSFHKGGRSTAVLNLSGLYGEERRPVNFGRKVANTMDKLEAKTSLHLVHGKDVARAIVGMYEALGDDERRGRMWGRRWIVTDTHVYDWWHLFTTLQPAPYPEAADWVKQLTAKHHIPALPRPAIGQGGERDEAPYVLDRALDSKQFWQELNMQPSVGRCDDYNPGGGGEGMPDGHQAREGL